MDVWWKLLWQKLWSQFIDIRHSRGSVLLYCNKINERWRFYLSCLFPWMLFPGMVCKIPEVILRRSLANSRDTSCHRSVIAATQHPGILAAWISPHYTLNFKVLRGKYCGHHTRPPYILRGQKFSLSVIFENLGAKPAHPRLSLLFITVRWSRNWTGLR